MYFMSVLIWFALSASFLLFISLKFVINDSTIFKALGVTLKYAKSNSFCSYVDLN